VTPVLHTFPTEQEIRDAYLRVSHAFEGAEPARRALYKDYLQFFDERDLVLDFGCGHGTWLEIVRDAGLSGLGIDYDPEMARQCEERGLEVICSDELSDAAVREPTAITAFHIIEHLPPMEVMRLLMTLDVRKVLLITPNIDHPIVPHTFWRDITHVRPYPVMVMEEMCRQAGFTGVVSGTQNRDLDSFVFAWKPGTPGWPDPQVAA
jgi:SAM-dependent methyltransferase